MFHFNFDHPIVEAPSSLRKKVRFMDFSSDYSVPKSLGIDLGSNSLGWAVVNSKTADILRTGVVIFDEGIIREKGNDSIKTPAAIRRGYRMARRIKFRRRLRKFAVLKDLIENEMCPLSPENLKAWKQEGVYPCSDRAFMQWLASSPESNPYADRAFAAERAVEKYSLGRAVYHIAQRRGFLSNRKDEMSAEETEGKDVGIVKADIGELSSKIQEFSQTSGTEQTLGQFFYDCFRKGVRIRKHHTGRKEHYLSEFKKIMSVQIEAGVIDQPLADKLEKEIFFQRPLRSQKNLVGNCPLEKRNKRAQLFRPEFEEYRMLTLVNNLRVLPDTENRALSDVERQRVISKFFVVARSIKIEALEKAIFDAKTIKRLKNENRSVRLLNYKSDVTVSANTVSQQLNNLFGTELDGFKSHIIHGKNKGEIREYDYNAVLDAVSFFDDNDKLEKFAKERFGFDDNQTKALLRIRIPDGYASFSLKAINKILPFLRKGIGLHLSILLANLPNLLAKKQGEGAYEQCASQIEDELFRLEEDVKQNREAAFLNHKVSVFPLRDRFCAYLQEEFKIPKEEFDRVLYRQEDSFFYTTDPEKDDILPAVKLGNIRNPLVQRSMTILRKLVNELRRNEIIDAQTHINIELAREVNDRNHRMAYETWQKGRAAAREKAKTEIEGYDGITPTDDLILRYLLWSEQAGMCLYTGKRINVRDILCANSQFDIEHTVPRCRSGDDSMANKTLCEQNYNRAVKVGRLPTECPNYSEIETRLRSWKENKLKALEKDYERQRSAARHISSLNPEKKASALQKAYVTKLELDYWRKKIHYFEIQDSDIGDAFGFINRQLVDTGIMARHAVQFLSSFYRSPGGKPNVWPVNGQATAFARKEWGLQDADLPKDRDNNIHHAIDAIVIALLNKTRFNRICSFLKDDTKPPIPGLTRTIVDPPCENFVQKVKEATSQVLVRHLSFHKETKQTAYRKRHLARPMMTKKGKISVVVSGGKTVRGQLHAETFYGCIHDPSDPNPNRTIFVVRKPIKDVKNFDEIIDPAVRETVKSQVAAIMSRTNESLDQVKKKLGESDGYTIWMKRSDEMNRNGIPILKVRIKAKLVSAHELRPQKFVSDKSYKNSYYVDSAAGSNFRLDVYAKGLSIANLLYWSKDPESIIRKDLGSLRGSVSVGSMVILRQSSSEDIRALGQSDFSSRVYKIYKFNYNSKQIEIFLRKHTEARALGSLKRPTYKTDFTSFTEPLTVITTARVAEHVLFEGIDFEMTIDGRITFKA